MFDLNVLQDLIEWHEAAWRDGQVGYKEKVLHWECGQPLEMVPRDGGRGPPKLPSSRRVWPMLSETCLQFLLVPYGTRSAMLPPLHADTFSVGYRHSNDFIWKVFCAEEVLKGRYEFMSNTKIEQKN